jgi:hypothetical protein
MTWLIWRQHRSEALALALLVTAIGVILVLLGVPMHALFPLGATHCAVPPLDHACRIGLTQLHEGYGYATPMLILLNFVPFAIGAFLGAPLLARELEAGTWQLAWTQAVPRARWLAVKVAALATLTVLLTAAFSALATWYRQPLDLFGTGRFQIDGFDVTGVVPPAYSLFAFALAGAAGLLLRRSLPALAAALVAFVAIRVTIAGWLRPHYRTPITLIEAIPPGSGDVHTGTANLQDGILDQGISDAAGRHLNDLAASMVEHRAQDAGMDPTTYLHDHGFHRWVTYQPADRFWTFQLTETGIFVGLAVLLLALVTWRVSRRVF